MIALPAWAVVTPPRVAHIERVAALVDAWAGALGVGAAEAERWRRAVLLHDALKDAGPEVLERYVAQDGWHELLWHGPAAAAAAVRHGETDPGVLSAVRYHSVGFAGWDRAGEALYLADYLEPGRAHQAPGRAAWAASMPADMDVVLREVAAHRIGVLIATGRPLVRETWEFWNRLVGAA